MEISLYRLFISCALTKDQLKIRITIFFGLLKKQYRIKIIISLPGTSVLLIYYDSSECGGVRDENYKEGHSTERKNIEKTSLAAICDPTKVEYDGNIPPPYLEGGALAIEQGEEESVSQSPTYHYRAGLGYNYYCSKFSN